jgi:hypothetical protein
MGRAFIELLRTDSCMIFESFISKDPLDFFGTSYEKGLKAFVYLSIILVVLSIALYIILKNKQTKADNELSELKTDLAEESNNGEPSLETEESKDNETNLTEETQQNVDSDANSQQRPSSQTTENATETADDEKGSDDYEDGEEGNDDYDEF